MSFVERIKVTDGTEVAAVTTANQIEVAITDSSNNPVVIKTLGTSVISTDRGIVTNSVIHGKTTGGGGGYVDVKVTPSGALNTDTTITGLDAGILGQDTMANSFPVVIASNQSAIPVSDGGSSLTVDGTFWQATQPVSLATVPSHPVTNAGTFAVQVDGAALTALQLIDDVVVTDNAGFTDGTTKLAMAGYIYDEVAGTTLTENDAAAGRINVNRAVVNVFEDGTTRGRYATVTAANALKIDGSAVTQPVSGTVSITANSSVNMAQIGGTNTVNGGTAGTIAIGGIQAHDAAISNNNPILCGSYYALTPTDVASGDVTRTWASPKGALLTGAKYEASPPNWALSGDTVYHLTLASDGRLRVDVDFTGKSITTVGNNAHDVADSGNPIKIGAKAIAHGTNPTQVAEADRTNLYANRHGILWTIGGHPNLQSAEYITTAAQTSGGDNVLPLISAGTKYVITGVTVTASAANTVNTSVRLGFGTTGVPAQGASAADAVTKVILSHPGIAPGSGVSKGHAGGIVGIGGDGEELYIVCSVPTGGSVVVQVDYYTIES